MRSNNYPPVLCIVSVCGEYIPISHIESINTSAAIDSEARTFDVLKGDYSIRVRLHSGREYVCSMQQNMALLSATPEYEGLATSETAEDFYIAAIHSAWLYIERKHRHI